MLRDMSFERFEVLPITGALGAEVRGIDLAAAPDDASFEDLRRALHHYRVLAVRDQDLPPPAFHAVARRFGPFSGNPVHTPIDGYEDIVRFVREPDDTGKVIGEEWHMDLAWMAKPPGITTAVRRGHSTARRRHLLRQPGAYLPLAHAAHAGTAGRTDRYPQRQRRVGGQCRAQAPGHPRGRRARGRYRDRTPRRLRPPRHRPALRVHQRRAEPLQGHVRGGEQADHRLPDRAGDPPREHLPRALGARNADAVGQSVRACTPRSTTMPAIAVSPTVRPWRAGCRRRHPPKRRSTAPPDRLERQPCACDRPLRQAGRSDARRASPAWATGGDLAVHRAGACAAARRHRHSGVLCRLAEPHRVHVRPRAGVRGSCQLPPGPRRPLFLARAGQHHHRRADRGACRTGRRTGHGAAVRLRPAVPPLPAAGRAGALRGQRGLGGGDVALSCSTRMSGRSPPRCRRSACPSSTGRSRRPTGC